MTPATGGALDRLMDLALGVYEYFEAGGPVMIPLIAVSIWLWTLIGMKLLEIRGYYKSLSGSSDYFFRVDCPRAGADEQSGEQVDLFRHSVRLDRHVETILLLAAAAPLLGLLGTVSGMIETFDVIGRHGSGYARGLAGGIAEALLTTQGGLMVALPGMLMGNFIKRRVERLKGRLEGLYLSRVVDTDRQARVAAPGGV